MGQNSQNLWFSLWIGWMNGWTIYKHNLLSCENQVTGVLMDSLYSPYFKDASCLWQLLTSGAEGDPAPESSDAIIRSCLRHHGTTEIGPIINTCDSSPNLHWYNCDQLSIERWRDPIFRSWNWGPQIPSSSHHAPIQVQGHTWREQNPIFRHTRQSQMPALPFAKAANYLKLKGSTPGPRSPCGYCVGALSIWGSAKSSRVRGSIFWHVMLVDSWF